MYVHFQLPNVSFLNGWLQLGATGLFAFCAAMTSVFLFKHYSKLESDRLQEKITENAELKREIKELQIEMQRLLLQVPRAQNDLIDIVKIVRELK